MLKTAPAAARFRVSAPQKPRKHLATQTNPRPLLLLVMVMIIVVAMKLMVTMTRQITRLKVLAMVIVTEIATTMMAV